MGIDDLELANLHQPQVVVGWVRCAVAEVLAERFSAPAARSRAEQKLRERCSFHLLAPMIEAYFFGERQALERAGVGSDIPHVLAHTDVEDFETDDPRFMPYATRRNDEMRALYPWWREEKHPKSYLEHLVTLAGGLYGEETGAAALRSLDWGGVSRGFGPLGFVRSLFEDLSDWFQLPGNVLGAGVCAPCTYPPRTSNRNTLTLRNL